MANNTWSNYTEKTATPVDADEVMVRDSTDGKNKRLLFGTFWKWVAKKLNEATISELQTSNKTIVGALNQLNSETSDATAKTFSATDDSAKILLKNTENTSLRYTALVFLCAQNSTMVGVYLIGVSGSNEKITKIVGNEATLTRDGNYVIISFVGRSSIWSNGIIIAPKLYL